MESTNEIVIDLSHGHTITYFMILPGIYRWEIAYGDT